MAIPLISPSSESHASQIAYPKRFNPPGHRSKWAIIGIGVGGLNPRDRWVIYAVSRGWC